MKNIISIFVVILLILLFNENSYSKERIKITFINPGISDQNDPTGGFWISVSNFMKIVADNFDINLEVIYSERDHFNMRRQAAEVVKRENQPDYLIVVNEKLSADEMVKIADEHEVKTFVILNAFVDEQAEIMGQPREKYKHFIGSLIPDNEYAGYVMAKKLIEEGKKRNLKAEDGNYYIVGIAGDFVTQASIERVNGLKRAISEYDNVVLKNIFTGLWRQDRAKAQILNALKFYPNTKLIWAANDPMAIGSIEAISESGKVPGKDILVSGLNWDKPALNKIQNGELLISMGGHFMTGGWAVILIHDYHKGKDFSNEGLNIKMPIFDEITAKNIENFLDLFSDGTFENIDFKMFSKVYNPLLEKYDFRLGGD